MNAVQSRQFNVGTFEDTNISENISLLREGFFLVMENGGVQRRLLTRAGDFELTENRYLRNSQGQELLGWAYDEVNDSLPGDYEGRRGNGDQLTRIDLLDHIYSFMETKNVKISFNLDARSKPEPNMDLYKNSRVFDFKNLAISRPQFSATQNSIESTSLINAGIFPGDKLTIGGSDLNDGEYTVVSYDRQLGRVTVQEELQDEAHPASINLRHENPKVAAQGVMVEGLTGVSFDPATKQMVAAGLIDANINEGDYLYINDPNNSQNNRSYLVEDFDPVTGTVSFANAPAMAAGFQELNVDIIKGNNKLLLHKKSEVENSNIEFISHSKSIRIPGLESVYVRDNDMLEIRTTSGQNDGFWVIESFDNTNGDFSLRSRDNPERVILGEELTNQDLQLMRYIPSQAGLGSITEDEITASDLIMRVDTSLREDDNVQYIDIVDQQGVSHNVKISFLKGSETNTWHMHISSPEAHAKYDVEGGLFHPGGIISFGTLVFEPDGSLSKDDSFMYAPNFAGGADGAVFERQSLEDFSSLEVVWSPDFTGASQAGVDELVPQTIDNFDFTGIEQMASGFVLHNINEDGMALDKKSSVFVDPQGWVKVMYSGGDIRKIYKIPAVSVTDPSKLLAVNQGSSFLVTDQTGNVVYDEVNSNNHVFQSGKIEISNKSINDEMMDIITYQQYFYSLQRLITTANELMEQVANLKN